MRNLSKVLALVLSLAFVLTMFASAVVVPAGDKVAYTDAEEFDSDAGKEAVRVLTALKVVKGYPNGDFRPDGDVTRAEYAKMIALAKTGAQIDDDADFTNWYTTDVVLPFTDVADGDWFKGYVNYAYMMYILAGYGDGTLRPANNVTGVEALKMTLVALGYDPKIERLEGADWMRNTMSLAEKTGLLDNLKKENMYAALDREATAILVRNALKENMVEYNNGFRKSTGKTLGDVAFGGIELAESVKASDVKIKDDGEYYIDNVKVTADEAKAALEKAKGSTAPIEKKGDAIYFYSYDVYKVKAVDGNKLTLWGKGDVTVVDAADIAANDYVVIWQKTLGNGNNVYAKELDVINGKVTAYTVNSNDGTGIGLTEAGGKYTINDKQYTFGSLAKDFDNEAKGLQDESDYFAQLLGEGSAAVADANLTFIVDGNFIVAVFVNENTYWENYAIVIGYNPIDNTLGMQHVRLYTDDNEYKDCYVATVDGKQIYNTILQGNTTSSSLMNGTDLPKLNTLVRYDDLGNNKVALYSASYVNAVSGTKTDVKLAFDTFSGNWNGYSIGAENKPQKQTTYNWENGVVFVSYKSLLGLEDLQDLINKLVNDLGGEMIEAMLGGEFEFKFAADEFTDLALNYNLQGFVSDIRALILDIIDLMYKVEDIMEKHGEDETAIIKEIATLKLPALLIDKAENIVDILVEEIEAVSPLAKTILPREEYAFLNKMLDAAKDENESITVRFNALMVLIMSVIPGDGEGIPEEALMILSGTPVLKMGVDLVVDALKAIVTELIGDYVTYQWRAYRYGEFQPDARDIISTNAAKCAHATVVSANSLNNNITLKAAAIEFNGTGEYLPGLPLRAGQQWGTVMSVTSIATNPDANGKYVYKFNILKPWSAGEEAITIYADYKLETPAKGDILKLFFNEDGTCRRFEIARTAQKLEDEIAKTNNYLEIGYYNITSAIWSDANNGWYLTLKRPVIEAMSIAEIDAIYGLTMMSAAYGEEVIFTDYPGSLFTSEKPGYQNFEIDSEEYFLPADSDAYFVKNLFSNTIAGNDYVVSIGKYGLTSLINDKSWEVYADVNPTTKTINSIWFNENKGSEPAKVSWIGAVKTTYDIAHETLTYELVGYDDAKFADGSKKYVKNVKPYEVDVPISFIAGWDANTGKTSEPGLTSEIPCYPVILTAELAENGGWYVTTDFGGYKTNLQDKSDAGNKTYGDSLAKILNKYDDYSDPNGFYLFFYDKDFSSVEDVKDEGNHYYYLADDWANFFWYRENYEHTNYLGDTKDMLDNAAPAAGAGGDVTPYISYSYSGIGNAYKYEQIYLLTLDLEAMKEVNSDFDPELFDGTADCGSIFANTAFNVVFVDWSTGDADYGKFPYYPDLTPKN